MNEQFMICAKLLKVLLKSSVNILELLLAGKQVKLGLKFFFKKAQSIFITSCIQEVYFETLNILAERRGSLAAVERQRNSGQVHPMVGLYFLYFSKCYELTF